MRALPIALLLAAPAPALAGTHAYFGLDLLWTFGGTRPLGAGLQLGVGHVPGPYGPAPELGLFLDARWTRFTYGSIAAGARLGFEAPAWNQPQGGFQPGFGLDAEVGWSADTRGRGGLRVGGRLGAGPLTAALDHVFTADEPIYGEGLPLPAWSGRREEDPPLPAWYPSPFADTTLSFGLRPFDFAGVGVVDGRPLRTAAGSRVARLGVAAGGSERARRWLREGRDEHAAVFAFARLARELSALGAPRALVGRARAAAVEEIGHAAMCFALASEALAAPIDVRGLTATPRHFRSREDALAVLAAESLVDGVVGEGLAADRAAAVAAATHDPTEAAVKARIAREERGHARLGADVARWCRAEGGRRVREALRGAERSC